MKLDPSNSKGNFLDPETVFQVQIWAYKLHDSIIDMLPDKFNEIVENAREIVVDTLGQVRLIMADHEPRIEIVLGDGCPRVTSSHNGKIFEIPIDLDYEHMRPIISELWFAVLRQTVDEL